MSKPLFDSSEFKSDLMSLIQTHKKSYCRLVKKRYPEFYAKIDEMVGNSWSEKLYVFLNGLPVCLTCGSSDLFFQSFFRGFSAHCSESCAHRDPLLLQKKKEELYQKHGVTSAEGYLENKRIHANDWQRDHRKKNKKEPKLRQPLSKEQKDLKLEKRRATCLERYGVDNPSKAQVIREKIVYQWASMDDDKKQDIIKKRKDTSLERYGVECTFQAPSVLEKIDRTRIERHGSLENARKVSATHSSVSRKRNLFLRRVMNLETVEPLFTETEYCGVENQWYPFKCHTCGTEFDGSLDNGIDPRCPVCFPKNLKISEPENEIKEFLREHGVDFQSNDTNIISPKELDIYLPAHHLAIEFGGLYWHSELRKEKRYHQFKYLACQEKGIQLLTVFHDMWLEKQDLLKIRILHLIGKGGEQRIFARKCLVQLITKFESDQFIDQFHLQGKPMAGNARYGLFFNGILVSVMIFGSARFFKRNKCLELIRYAVRPGYQIVGGASKLMHRAISDLSPTRIISYADHLHSTGDFYLHLGFQKTSTQVGYTYTDNRFLSRKSRLNFTRQKLLAMIDTKEESNMQDWTENQLANHLKLYRVYDAGVSTYIMEIT